MSILNDRPLTPTQAFESAGGEWSTKPGENFYRESAIAAAFFCEYVARHYGIDPMFARFNVVSLWNHATHVDNEDEVWFDGCCLKLAPGCGYEIPEGLEAEIQGLCNRASLYQPHEVTLMVWKGEVQQDFDLTVDPDNDLLRVVLGDAEYFIAERERKGVADAA